MSMTAEALVNTKGMDRKDWLEWRKQGIGGSDAAAIAGLSKWKSPVEVYLEKVGEIEPGEPGEAAYWGIALEDLVAQEFTKRTGLKVRRRNAILQHPEHKFMIANIDREIVGQRSGVECKTTSAFNDGQWEGDRIPDVYTIQCQHYMAVTGYPSWYIAVLIGGQKFIQKRIDRDEEIISYLIKIESDFWKLVESRTPPAVDGSESSTEVLNILYPKAEAGTEIRLPLDAEALIAEYEAAQADEKAASLRKDEAANKIKALLGTAEVGLVGERKVSWKTVVSNRFDSKLFQSEHPKLYELYAKPSEYRRFAVK